MPNESADNRRSRTGTEIELLGPQERAQLAALEGVVERGLNTFVEVGAALLQIQSERLYREQYGSFKDYLNVRWEISRSRGYQLIDSARVAGVLSTVVDVPAPANEAQARELVPLLDAEDELVDIWRQLASHGQPLTAERVRAAVAERRTPPAAGYRYSVPRPKGELPEESARQLVRSGLAIMSGREVAARRRAVNYLERVVVALADQFSLGDPQPQVLADAAAALLSAEKAAELAEGLGAGAGNLLRVAELLGFESEAD